MWNIYIGVEFWTYITLASVLHTVTLHFVFSSQAAGHERSDQFAFYCAKPGNGPVQQPPQGD